MKNIFNKTNAPYLAVGALATLALVSSGVFAVAPYIGFLAPVAALSLGLPFIIGCAVFSAVAIALSAVAISKNNTISGKDAVVQAQKQTISESEAKIQAQEQTISGQNDQLSEKVKEISGKDAKLVDQAKEIEGKDKIISERDTKIEKDALKVEIADGTVQLVKGTFNSAVSLIKGAVNGVLYSSKYAYDNYVPSIESTKGTISSVGSGVKNTCDASIESAKGTISSVGNGMKNAYDILIQSTKGTLSGIGSGVKNTYDASIASVREALNSVGSSLYSRFHGTKVSSKEKFESRVAQRKQEEARTELKASGSLPDVIELKHEISSPEKRLDCLDLVVPSSEQKQRANSLDYLNIDNVSKQPDYLNVDAAKSYLMSLSEGQDVSHDAESGDEKDTVTPSPANEPAKLDDVAVSNLSDENSKKEENVQGWGAWGKAKVAATVTAGIGLCGAALCYATQYIPTVLNGVVASSMGNSASVNNGTFPSQ
ncbi:MAG: hypothetical protein O7157_02435 [Wolbachia endosymbiont of Tetragnatha montana]|nr:hypothetical protein [Wolbachia endosymbiont of Tetragnatha montana]